MVLDESKARVDRAPDLTVPPATEEADELMLVSRWLKQARRVRCEHAIGVAVSRFPPVADYARVRDD